MVRHAWLLLSSLQVADAEPAQEVVEKAEYKFAPIDGTEFCLVANYGPAAYTNNNGDAIRLDSDGTTDMKGCAAKCIGDCKSWTFVTDASGDHACWDVTPLAPAGSPGSVPLVYDTSGTKNPMTGLAGKCSCPSTSSTALTGDNFPAKTDTDYESLFPVTHRQPAPLACWPKNEFGQFKPAVPVVLRDNQLPKSDPKYFAGWCNGMSKQGPLDAGVSCEKACRDKPMCSGFQEVPENSPRTPGCFFGAGYDCDNEETGTQALQAGQSADASDNDMKAMRFGRGFVKVIATIRKYRVQGLKQRFDEKAFTMDDPNAVANGADSGDGGQGADDNAVATTAAATTVAATTAAPTTVAATTTATTAAATTAPADTTTAAAAATEAAAGGDTPARRLGVPQVTDWPTTVLRCREVCEADLHCTVWQVYQPGGTAPNSGLGCWTESVDSPLPYPLSRDDDKFVKDETGVRDGAFIQHWFSEDVTTTTVAPAPPPPPPNRLLPILLTLGGLAALLGVGAYAMGWCNAKEKPNKKRARNKATPAPEPPKEEPQSEPVPTQSALLMSAPVLTYSAAPVTYAAPVATHHVAPLSYAAPPVTTASYQVVHPSSTVPHTTVPYSTTMPYSTSVVVPHDTAFMG